MICDYCNFNKAITPIIDVLSDLQNSQGSEILLFLQGNKLACHSFMDIGRKCEIPGLEQKTFITYRNRKQSINICTSSPNTNSHKEIQRGPGSFSTFSEVCYRTEISNLES